MMYTRSEKVISTRDREKVKITVVGDRSIKHIPIANNFQNEKLTILDDRPSPVITYQRGQDTERIIPEQSEIGEAIRELNTDKLEAETNMSGIDMKSRLHPIEVMNILALDALVQLRFCPPETLGFTRQKKRLSVSLDGKGREEIVHIVVGERDHQESKGFIGRIGSGIKNFMTGGKMT